MSLVGRAIEAVVEKGPREGLRFVWDRAKTYVVDEGRELVLLRVDLTEAKNRVRDRDKKDGFRLIDLEPSTVGRVQDMLQKTAPARIPNVEDRLAQGMSGLIGEQDGEVIGYVFYRGGSDDMSARVHPDLDWIPFSPKKDEIYTFDYFIPEAKRGLGNLLARSVQERQHELGYVASYGYVYADNRAALWLYRTIGWKEIGRIREQKLLLKFALVEDRLFFIRQYDRKLIGRVPWSAG